MIFDHLREQARYRALHPGLDRAFNYVRTFDPATPDGKYELDGSRLVAMPQSYVTKPASEKKYEAHERFIDLQFIVAGTEAIYHAPLERLTLTDAYRPEKDCAFYSGEDAQALVMRAGDFSILFPHDGHKPGCTWQSEGTIRKIVVKIAI